MKIANKISLSFFITAVILTVSAVTAIYYIEKENLKTAIFNHLITAVQSRTYHIESLLENYRKEVTMLAAGNAFKDAVNISKDYDQRIEQANRRIRNTLQICPNIARIRVLDKNGIIIASSHKDTGFDKSVEEIFSKSRESAYIGEMHLSELTGNIVISAAAPIILNGEFAGIVILDFSDKELFKITTGRTGLGKTGEIYLIDKNGYMITPSRFKENTLLKLKVDTENTTKAFEDVKKFGTEEHKHEPLLYIDYRGVKVLAIHDHINLTKWILIAEIDEKEALAPLQKIKYLLISIIIVTPILAWLLGIFIGGVISRPIHVLHKGSEVIGSGNLDYKIGTNSKDEIGQLSRAFDKMTTDLKGTVVSRDYVDNIVSSMADILVVVTPDEKIEKVNRATLDVLGYSEKELIGKDVRCLFLEEEEEEEEEEIPLKGTKLEKLIKEGILKDYEIELKTKDNKKIPVLLSGAVMKDKDGNITNIVCVAKDITERKKAERELLRSKQDWESLFYSIDEAITIHDTDFNITHANKGAETILGLSMSEILKQKCFFSYHGKTCPPDDCPSCSTLKTGIPTITEVFEPQLKKHIEVMAAPRFDADHNIIGVIHVVRDITGRKKAESELKEAYNKLKETQSQLIHTEKMDAIGRMASGVAHEVKNPLGIILQTINYFEETIPSNQKDEHELLHIMKNSVKRADSIVSALLDFSRSEALNIKSESINPIIESSLNLVEHKMKIKDIKVSQELEKDLLEVSADRGKVEQVFVNLINNAADAMPKGGSLYIRSYMARLDNSGGVVRNKKNDISKLGEEAVVVEIEDTGVGMDEDVKKKLFDPFFTTKNRAEGTGLGLSVTKSIMDMHQGLINMESEKDKGTKFTMIFKISGGG